MRYFLIKFFLITALLPLYYCSKDSDAQEPKARMKLGAYYFDGWSGKCYYDDGKPEHAWATGLPTHATKSLITEFAGREPIWGWREDTQEIMKHQIDLAADNGIAFFSFCWYGKNSDGALNVPLIESYSFHQSMYRFMNAKNNSKMEFCLLVANHGASEINGTNLWKQAADFWITKYFDHPRYLKVGDKPVIIIFSPKGADKEGLIYLQEAAKKAGFPGVYNTRPPNSAGLNMTDIYPFQLMVDWSISVWNNTNIPMPYIPCLTTGWDRRPWEAKNGEGLGEGVTVTNHFARGTHEEFEQYVKSLADWMDAYPWQITKDRLAVVYAWNEMGEGGWLVPCTDDPEGLYLKAIRKVVFGK